MALAQLEPLRHSPTCVPELEKACIGAKVQPK